MIDILLPLRVITNHDLVFRQFLQRAIARRYRLSAFGLLWTVLVPLFTLAIYTLVFGVILQSRWSGSADAADTSAFGLYLFSGLIVFWLMADVVGAAPVAVVEYTNLVKKAVFPLEVLPLVAVGSAVFHALISTAVLLAAILFFKGALPATALFVPLILFPFVLLLMGFGWLLSAIGVFFRDIQHI
ncbi:MAG: ABC transporter permease, partial [Rhodospirillaceae bacterium]